MATLTDKNRISRRKVSVLYNQTFKSEACSLYTHTHTHTHTHTQDAY